MSTQQIFSIRNNAVLPWYTALIGSKKHDKHHTNNEYWGIKMSQVPILTSFKAVKYQDMTISVFPSPSYRTKRVEIPNLFHSHILWELLSPTQYSGLRILVWGWHPSLLWDASMAKISLLNLNLHRQHWGHLFSISVPPISLHMTSSL